MGRGPACFRLHQARPPTICAGESALGKKKKRSADDLEQAEGKNPRYLPQSLWRRVPKELIVRGAAGAGQPSPAFRHQKRLPWSPPLSDEQAYPASELAETVSCAAGASNLWWAVTSKTSMGMEVLRLPRAQPWFTKELEMVPDRLQFNSRGPDGLNRRPLYQRRLEQISFKRIGGRPLRQYRPTHRPSRAPAKKPEPSDPDSCCKTWRWI